jgi:hypothetical protein
MIKEKWTTPDITKMKIMYLNNVPLKIIARDLDRSPTSINKALSRFGIRHSRMINVQQPIRIRRPGDLPKTHPSHKCRQGPEWVTMQFVENWLVNQQFTVQRCSCPRSTSRHYIIGHEHMDAAGLVMLFNKIRLQLGLEPLWVEAVTW